MHTKTYTCMNKLIYIHTEVVYTFQEWLQRRLINVKNIKTTFLNVNSCNLYSGLQICIMNSMIGELFVKILEVLISIALSQLSRVRQSCKVWAYKEFFLVNQRSMVHSWNISGLCKNILKRFMFYTWSNLNFFQGMQVYFSKYRLFLCFNEVSFYKSQ